MHMQYFYSYVHVCLCVLLQLMSGASEATWWQLYRVLAVSNRHTVTAQDKDIRGYHPMYNKILTYILTGHTAMYMYVPLNLVHESWL